VLAAKDTAFGNGIGTIAAAARDSQLLRLLLAADFLQKQPMWVLKLNARLYLY